MHFPKVIYDLCDFKIYIRLVWIHKFLGLPGPDPLVRATDPDSDPATDPDPYVTKCHQSGTLDGSRCVHPRPLKDIELVFQMSYFCFFQVETDFVTGCFL